MSAMADVGGNGAGGGFSSPTDPDRLSDIQGAVKRIEVRIAKRVGEGCIIVPGDEMILLL